MPGENQQTAQSISMSILQQEADQTKIPMGKTKRHYKAAIYHLLDVNQLKRKRRMTSFSCKKYLVKLELVQLEQLYFAHPDYFFALDLLFYRYPLAVWNICWRLLSANVPSLSVPFVRISVLKQCNKHDNDAPCKIW